MSQRPRLMQVEILSATRADEHRLENLLELYIHDFSEILGIAPRDDGRFGYARLALYWDNPDRFAFVIRADGRLAGFALVARGSQISADPTVLDMAEFFVVRGLRRRGVALSAAQQVFAAMAGRWEVRVLERNTGALRFWERAVSTHTDGRFATDAWQADDGASWRVFRFVTPSTSEV